MKIGILTLPIAENYGGILQAVALYQLLEQEGHEVSLIYKPHVPQLWKEAIRKVLEAIPAHNLFNVKTTKQARKEWSKRRALHRPFIEKEIRNISPSLTSSKQLKEYALEKKFDAVIVGSDQVWRKAYINDRHYKSYFLDFIPTNSDTKKIAYAASFGKDHWEGIGDAEEIEILLNDFTAISVREASGIKVCKDTFNISGTKHVLDPTLLMPKKYYLDLISRYDTSNLSPKKLVTYVLDESEEKNHIIKHYQNKLQIETEDTRHLRGFNPTRKTYSVPEWLKSLAEAEFIITDSFHGMVFSIIFEKQFIVIGNSERGLERFSSLLNILKIEDRLTSYNHKEPINTLIDYKKISELLHTQKTHSKAFLHKALS